MHIFIDQSDKIEETSCDTYLAFSNSASDIVKITARTKRRLQENFRQAGLPKHFVLTVFSAGIYLLMLPHNRVAINLTIDSEYPGQEIVLSWLLISMFHNISVSPVIMFKSIGKNNKAHIRVYRAYKSKETVRTLTYGELYNTCFDIKNGHPTLKYHFHKGR